MKGICPNCEKTTEQKAIATEEMFHIKGEAIPVQVEFLKCLECGAEFSDPAANEANDPVELAYREYRKRNHLLQPEEIKELRKKYGLTQGELSELLGWGKATLSRYENGALQDEAHEKVLRLIAAPANLLKLIQQAPAVLPAEKRQQIMKGLNRLEKVGCSVTRVLEESLEEYGPDEFNGYQKIDLSKTFNLILYYCQKGVLKTKLNKLLFYTDFLSFKEFSAPITGLRYVRYHYGPIPDKYHLLFTTLFERGLLNLEEVPYNDFVGENYLSRQKPDLLVFSDHELRIIATIKDYFKDFSASAISDFSHREIGYQETDQGHFISFKYAQNLNFSAPVQPCGGKIK